MRQKMKTHIRRKRQKVKTRFLPGYIAKKGKQSSPFFGNATRCHPHAVRSCDKCADRADFVLGLHGLKPGFAWFQTPR
jgi:hypothetical protein